MRPSNQRNTIKLQESHKSTHRHPGLLLMPRPLGTRAAPHALGTPTATSPSRAAVSPRLSEAPWSLRTVNSLPFFSGGALTLSLFQCLTLVHSSTRDTRSIALLRFPALNMAEHVPKFYSASIYRVPCAHGPALAKQRTHDEQDTLPALDKRTVGLIIHLTLSFL